MPLSLRGSTLNFLVSISKGRSLALPTLPLPKTFLKVGEAAKIRPTAASQILRSYVLGLFRKHYRGGAVRRLGVRYDDLVDKAYRPFSFFDDLEALEKMEALDLVVDEIRNDYGFLAIQRGDSLLEGARAIERSKLIGGHCGGMEGIK